MGGGGNIFKRANGECEINRRKISRKKTPEDKDMGLQMLLKKFYRTENLQKNNLELKIISEKVRRPKILEENILELKIFFRKDVNTKNYQKKFLEPFEKVSKNQKLLGKIFRTNNFLRKSQQEPKTIRKKFLNQKFSSEKPPETKNYFY